MNPFSENFILKGVLEFLGNILDFLNPFSDNFILKTIIESIGNILSYINPFSENFLGYKLISLLGDLLKMLFVPDAEEIESKFNSVKEKFAFIDSIKITISDLTSVVTNEDNAPIFTINVMPNKWFSGSVNVIDLSWYAPYKTYGDTIICCFAYAFFFWRIFIHLSDIISGAGGSIESYSQSQDIEAYRRFGFGRRKKM